MTVNIIVNILDINIVHRTGKTHNRDTVNIRPISDQLEAIKSPLLTLQDIYSFHTSPCPTSGGSKGGARDAPPLGQNFFIFMQFSGKISQIVDWRPP